MSLRRARLIFLCSCLVSLLVPIPIHAAEEKAAGLDQDVARQVAAAIPVDLKMGTVAIGQIENDGDGRLAHALTGALTKLNRFKVIERRDLDKLLEEQGVQTRDWIDPKERVKFGKVKGVQGLFLGKIVERSSGMLQDALKVQLKLDDVERGQVVFAKDFVATELHYGPLMVLGIILAVLVGLVLMVLGRKRTVTKTERLVQADQKERTINTEELNKAMADLGRAQSVLYEKGLQAEAIKAKDLGVQLRTLKDKIALAPTGGSDRHTTGKLRQVVSFDQEYRTLAEAVTLAAAALCDRAAAGDKAEVERNLQEIGNRIREAEATFRNRGV